MSNRVEKKVESILSPIQALVRDESVASAFLFFATVISLALANSRYSQSYFSLLELPILLKIGSLQLEFHLKAVVNDGLMTLFFLVLGLEIKRELLVGELQDASLAVTVLAAALGGMLVPGLIYFLANVGHPTVGGWGIPMATDTAFALGVLLFLGDRVPSGLKAFLVAFAIIDDLGAIVVIALFYTDTLDPTYLGVALLCVVLLLICNAVGFRHLSIYLALGLVLWACLVSGGVHGTVAGVLVAAAVPARPKHDRRWFVSRAREIASDLEHKHKSGNEQDILGDLEQHATVEAAEKVAKSASTPLRRWERALERPILLLVLPLFALANAGIPIDRTLLTSAAVSPVTWGIFGGLVFGKVMGVSALAWISTRAGWGRLPDEVSIRHVFGVAMLGGMGFTMSIFIADLSFSSALQLDEAKIAILCASALAGIGGYVWLRYLANT